MKKIKQIANIIFMMIFWGFMLYFLFVWIGHKKSEREFYMEIYQLARNEVKNHWENSCNLEFAEYDRDNIRIQEWDLHDFGYGNLRYGRFAVTVPFEFDDVSGHYEQESTINVYYYTSDQQVSEGIDTSVQNHFFVPDMYEEKWNQMFENTSNLE